MAVHLDILDNVRIASPCEASWSAMHGDDRVRFCDLCKLNVFNISALSRHDAEQLIIEKQGKLCVRYFQRTDGTILTQDCPRGIARLRHAFRRLLFRGAAACLSLFAALTALAVMPRGSKQLSLRAYDPFQSVAEWTRWLEDRLGFAPAQQPGQGRFLAGDISPIDSEVLESLPSGELEAIDEEVHRRILRSPGFYGRQSTAMMREAARWWLIRRPDSDRS